MTVSRFNIRVYGILLHAGCVLVSNEMIKNAPVVKFPGGGLVPGEGTLECLRREILEEVGMEAKDLRHFYTTDFFQPSAYCEEDQIVSIYYTFRVSDPDSIKDGAPAQGAGAEPGQHFRWIPLDQATEHDVDLPIDRLVMKLLLGAKRA
ncbi:MAG: NUDIX domain-containing protein [Flavobacteriales bacterium]|jgi:8-oxo-dGTP pyrophosphatase MutT (NUDIX family)|nr:NUDIX domain-containing protein [Flavobacteriales bacterium]